MRLLVIILALSSVLLGMTSCTRGGNIDKGDDGIIGEHGTTADENDGAHDNERRRDADDGIMHGDNGIIDDNNGMIPDANGRRATDRNGGNVTGDNDGGLSGRISPDVDNFEDGGMMPEGIFPDAIRR